MLVVDSTMMQAIDALACTRVSADTLMSRAGKLLALLTKKVAPHGVIVAFAGPGNNGGDAFAACAELAACYPCTVYTTFPGRPSIARAAAEERARAAGVTIAHAPTEHDELKQSIEHAALVLDGMLGVGARNDTSAFTAIIEVLQTSRTPILAIDLPTGLDGSNGNVAIQGAVRANWTLMLGLPKLGAMLEHAREYTGDLWLGDIGLTDEDTLIDPVRASSHSGNSHASIIQTLTPAQAFHLWPRRSFISDKRSAGAPLVIAGSAQFPGAAVLCARGAARCGAGYVTVATPQGTANHLRTHLVEQVVAEFDTVNITEAVKTLVDLARHSSAIAIGPGMPLDESTSKIIRSFIEQTTLPLVIDASGLTHIAKHLEILRNRACVVTPHEKEFARLSGEGTIEQGSRSKRLAAFVQRTGITTLLKGAVTLIADEATMHINPTGSNALATAGTGDVLTGMIATLLSQGLLPIDAARLAAYLHGLTGQIVAASRPIGVIAGDIPDYLATGFRCLPQNEGHLIPLSSPTECPHFII